MNLGAIGCWNGGGSINVKSKLPDVYTKLTKDNFFIEPARATVIYGTPVDGTGEPAWGFSKSYNAQTGVLSMGQMGGQVIYHHLHGGLQSCTAYAVYTK